MKRRGSGVNELCPPEKCPRENYWGKGCARSSEAGAGEGELKTDPADGDMENVPCWAESQSDSNAPRVTTLLNAKLSFSGQCYQMSPEISPVWRDHFKR